MLRSPAFEVGLCVLIGQACKSRCLIRHFIGQTAFDQHHMHDVIPTEYCPKCFRIKRLHHGGMRCMTAKETRYFLGAAVTCLNRQPGTLGHKNLTCLLETTDRLTRTPGHAVVQELPAKGR